MNDAIKREYDRWCSRPDLPAELAEELRQMRGDERLIEDRFYTGLQFGTGGLRGVLGAGPNAMNVFTVSKATQGLANYLLAAGPETPKSVAIAHDSRINSRLFAETAASVLAANGITAWLYPRLQPTPALSWAVRRLRCAAGICVTASHNPAAYNGYKVYGPGGCQVTTAAARAIQAQIDGVDVLGGFKTRAYEKACLEGRIRPIPEEALDEYIEAVLALNAEAPQKDVPLRVVYTPLNGAGLECVERILGRIGVDDLLLVKAQAEPDGNFPTCPYPNPEVPEALALGMALCEESGGDLLLATDPDCDRVGVAVPQGGEMRILTGNEIGILLLEYLCETRLAAGAMPKDPTVVTTIVSTPMADAVCEQYGLRLVRTLTGFKFIGEQIGRLEAEGRVDSFLFGFEESYGYLSGPHVRDKDGVNAAMLICQMARRHKKQGHTLAQAMDALYDRYGYWVCGQESYAFEGVGGMRQMEAVMHRLRAEAPARLAGKAVTQTIDYQPGHAGLPPADVLEFRLEGGHKLIVRPSGTEPKLKAYLFAGGASQGKARETAQKLAQDAKKTILG